MASVYFNEYIKSTNKLSRMNMKMRPSTEGVDITGFKGHNNDELRFQVFSFVIDVKILLSCLCNSRNIRNVQLHLESFESGGF